MTLLSNWKDVLTRAWSVRLVGFGLMAELALQYFSDGLPPWAVVLLLVGVFGSRFVAQEGLSKSENEEPAYDEAV